MHRTTLIRLAGAAVAAFALIAAGVCANARLRQDRDTDAAARFFTIPTRTICAGQDLVIEATGGRFAAHLFGEAPRDGGKYLSVDVTAWNRSAGTASFTRSYFTLMESSGAAYTTVSLGESAGQLDRDIAAGGATSGPLIFIVPQSFGAGKLTYDDGCGRQAWIVP